MGRMTQQVAINTNPLAGGIHRLVLPEGWTLDRYVAAAHERGALPPYFSQPGIGEVRLNGHLVPRDRWHRVRPKARDARGNPVVVEMVIPMRGGRSRGAGKVFSAVAAVALAATAFWVSGGGLAAAFPSLFGSFTAGSFAATALGAGLSFLGALALGALAPPPLLPNTPDAPDSGIERQIAGIQPNPARPLDSVPAVVGRMRVSPPQIVPPYSELDGGVLRVRAVYALAGKYDIDDIKVNGTDLSGHDGVTFRTLNVVNWASERLPGVESTIREKRVSATLSNMRLRSENGRELEILTPDSPEDSHPVWWVGASHSGDPNVVRLFIGFRAGIFTTEGWRAGVPIRLDIRPAGGTDWVTLPELHFSDPAATQRQIFQTIELVFGDPPVGARPIGDGTVAAFAYAGVPPNEGRPQAHSFYAATNYLAHGVDAHPDGFRIYIPQQVLPAQQIEVRVKRGLAYAWNEWDAYNYRLNGVFPVFYEHLQTDPPRAQRRQDDLVSDVNVLALQTETPGYPCQLNHVCLMAVEAVDTEIQSLSVIAHRHCATKASGWMVDAPTRNPAAIYRQMLVDARWNAVPVPTDLIEQSEIDAWYDSCEQNGWTCDAVINGRTSLEQSLQLVAAAGYAQPGYGDRLRPIRDYDRAAEPVMMVLGPHNTRNMTSEISLPDIPDAIQAEFNDASLDYAAGRALVWRDGADKSDPTIEVIRYDGITDENAAIKRARYDLLAGALRREKVRCEIFTEHLLVRRGDLVGVAMPTVGQVVDSFRVVGVERNGNGDVIALLLDSPPNWQRLPRLLSNMGDLSTAGILSAPHWTATAAIQTTSGVEMLGVKAPPEVDVWSAPDVWSLANVWVDAAARLELAQPWNDGGAYSGGIGALGTGGVVTRRMIVMAIRPNSDMTAEIELISEAPDIWRSLR